MFTYVLTMQKPNNTAKANRFLGSETFLILPFLTQFLYIIR